MSKCFPNSTEVFFLCDLCDYAGKADLRKAYWNPKRKVGVATHFNNILKKRQNIKQWRGFFPKLKLNYL